MPLSNKEIENRAVEVVLNYELRKNRNARDVRREGRSCDVESTERIIEVKGIAKTLSNSGNWRFIQQKSVQLMLKENNFYIYIVDNLENGVDSAGIYILNRTESLPYLKIAPQVFYTLQIPATERERYRKN